MGASRRHLRDQAAELRLVSQRRFVCGLLIGSTLATLAAWPWGTTSVSADVPLVPTPLERRQWLDVAERLEHDVPARVLLGGSESSSRLDAELGMIGMPRERFRVAARFMVDHTRRVACGTDARVDVDRIARNIDLPAGARVAPAADDDVFRSPETDLVHRLMRRLAGASKGDRR